jgi:hypothetical protein
MFGFGGDFSTPDGEPLPARGSVPDRAEIPESAEFVIVTGGNRGGGKKGIASTTGPDLRPGDPVPAERVEGLWSAFSDSLTPVEADGEPADRSDENDPELVHFQSVYLENDEWDPERYALSAYNPDTEADPADVYERSRSKNEPRAETYPGEE